jgi:hypothetical protein
MASPVAGKSMIVQVSSGSTDGSYSTIGECDNTEFTNGMQLADISQFGDSSKRQMASGISEFSGTLKGKNTPGDAGQAIVNAACLDGSLHYLKVLPDGLVGAKCPVVFKPYKVSAKQGPEAQGWDISFEPGGGVAPVAGAI